MAAFAEAIRTPGPWSLRRLDVAAGTLAHCMRNAAMSPERGVVALTALVREVCHGWNPSLAERPLTEPSRRSAVYAHAFARWVATYYSP